MTQYDNNMRGVLFKNDRKQTDNHPDYNGSCEIEGVEYWMNAWLKNGKNGTFMSFSFKPKEPKQNAPANTPAQIVNAPAEEFSDIPF